MNAPLAISAMTTTLLATLQPLTRMERRRFLRNTLASAGMLAFGRFPNHLYAAPTKRFASDRVVLGKSGITVSRLAMGTGTNGFNNRSSQTDGMGLHGLADWLEAAYDQDVNFWDSADQYGTHPHLREALKRIPREKVVILTKTHARTEAQMKADLDRFRRELGTDYLDIVLLHNMQSSSWPEERRGAMDALSQAKEDGLVRMHGVSCHRLGALKAAARTDWVEIDLARINLAGVIMDGSLGEVVPVLQEMKSKGKVVMGMKIIGAGRLSDQVDDCLQFALAQEFVDCFTIGTQDIPQFEDLVARIPRASVKV